jgi:hypothetical protein
MAVATVMVSQTVTAIHLHDREWSVRLLIGCGPATRADLLGRHQNVSRGEAFTSS